MRFPFLRASSLGGAALAVLLALGTAPAAHASGPSAGDGEAAAWGGTLSLRTLSDDGTPGAAAAECNWEVETYAEWWWDEEYALTRVDTESDGLVECDPDIYAIESELYVRHDETLISVDRDYCVSDDGDDCASSVTEATHSCTTGTSCAGDWTAGLELRLETGVDDSWDPDTFPDSCTIEGAYDEVARCYLEGEPPITIPPSFEPDTAGR